MLFANFESEQKYRLILNMIKQDINKQEICKKLKIDEQTFYKYTQRGVQNNHLKKANYIVLPAFDEYLKNNDLNREINKILEVDKNDD